MSKVKYPDKDKIRIQIDEILDKSELFSDSQNNSIHTSDKIVELKPVKQHLPVGKYITAVATIAAIVIFVISVKNYSNVGTDKKTGSSLVPLATGSSQADTQEDTQADTQSYTYGNTEEATASGSEYADMPNEGVYSYRELYSGVKYNEAATIYVEKRIEYGYTYLVRYDKITTYDNIVLYIDVPYNIEYNGKQLDGMDEAAVETLKKTIESYISNNGLKKDIKISCYIINNMLEFYVGDNVYGVLSLSQK